MSVIEKARLEQMNRDIRLVRERVLPFVEGADTGWALERILDELTVLLGEEDES